MKIHKNLTKHGTSKDFYKYGIWIPSEAIKQLEWDENTELDWLIRNGKLVLTEI